MTGETQFMRWLWEEPTDILWQTGGGENVAVYFINFNRCVPVS